tara:strand:- start:432 stop:611 length:180 start_codon:yes stop_codon:yes gene_type:complete
MANDVRRIPCLAWRLVHPGVAWHLLNHRIKLGERYIKQEPLGRAWAITHEKIVIKGASQ